MEEKVKLIIPPKHHANRQHSLRLGVLCPNILISQLHCIDHPGARKIYYLLLAENHWESPDIRVYHIPFSAVYPLSDRNSKARGEEIKERIRKHAQEKSFTIPGPMAKELFNTHGQSNYNVSPIESVEFIDKHFVIELTQRFKTLVQNTRKGYTKGDLSLLLSFKYAATDLFYWYIRSQQYHFTYKEQKTQEWKNTFGYSGMRTNNFTGKIIPKALEELSGTWAEFRHNITYKGNAVKTIRLDFTTDEKLSTSIKEDLRYCWEFELLKEGLEPGSIMAARRKILNKERVGEGKTLWCASYIHYVLLRTRSLLASGKVSSLKDYVLKSLENASFLSHYEKKELPYDSLGITKRSPTHEVPAEGLISLEEIHSLATLQNMSMEKYIAQMKKDGAVYYRYRDDKNILYMVSDKVHTSIVEELQQKYFQ